MYSSERTFVAYLAERLTDAQLAFTTSELRRQRNHVMEERRERRFPVSEIASLYSLNPLRPHETPIQLVDVSRSGLGIASTKALECGANIQIHLKNMLVVGEVRYSAPVGDSFHSGILIESVLRRTDRTTPTVRSDWK